MTPPDHVNGSPQLPPMSPAERELWMISHRAPEGMMMVHRNELARMAGSVRASANLLGTMFKLLQSVKQEGEEPVATLVRILRDLGRLTIERNAYKFQLSEEQLTEAQAEIKAKLKP